MNTLETIQSLAESAIADYPESSTKWHYEHGLFFQSLLALGDALKTSRYESFVESRMKLLVMPDGSVPTYRKGEFNLDQINPGKTVWELYLRTKDPRYLPVLRLLREQLADHPRTKAGPFWHKKIYPSQVWLDGQYMAGPFYARCAEQFSDPADFDDICAQLVTTRDKTRDPATGLFYHAWDESRQMPWSDKTTGCSPHFWGRAIGWYAMALVDVLDLLPQNHTRRPELLSIVADLAAALDRYRDPKSGLWYQILDRGSQSGNYIETSCSSMFVYFFAKAVNQGHIAAEPYGETARSGLASLLGNFLVETASGGLGLGNTCEVAGLGGTPYRDGSFEYYVGEPRAVNDFKGLGPLILAGIEVEALSSDR